MALRLATTSCADLISGLLVSPLDGVTDGDSGVTLSDATENNALHVRNKRDAFTTPSTDDDGVSERRRDGASSEDDATRSGDFVPGRAGGDGVPKFRIFESVAGDFTTPSSQDAVGVHDDSVHDDNEDDASVYEADEDDADEEASAGDAGAGSDHDADSQGVSADGDPDNAASTHDASTHNASTHNATQDTASQDANDATPVEVTPSISAPDAIGAPSLSAGGISGTPSLSVRDAAAGLCAHNASTLLRVARETAKHVDVDYVINTVSASLGHVMRPGHEPLESTPSSPFRQISLFLECQAGLNACPQIR